MAKRDYLVDAAKQIRQALDREVNEDYEAAFNHYKNGIDLLLKGVQVDPNKERREAVKRKTTQYLRRAEEIFNSHLQGSLVNMASTSQCYGFSSLRFRPIRILSSPVEDLKMCKVIGVIDKVLLVQNPVSKETFVVKSLFKSILEGREHQTIIPQGVPYMARLLRYYVSEDAILLHLEHVQGGRLFSHLRKPTEWNKEYPECCSPSQKRIQLKTSYTAPVLKFEYEQEKSPTSNHSPEHCNSCSLEEEESTGPAASQTLPTFAISDTDLTRPMQDAVTECNVLSSCQPGPHKDIESASEKNPCDMNDTEPQGYHSQSCCPDIIGPSWTVNDLVYNKSLGEHNALSIPAKTETVKKLLDSQLCIMNMCSSSEFKCTSQVISENEVSGPGLKDCGQTVEKEQSNSGDSKNTTACKLDKSGRRGNEPEPKKSSESGIQLLKDRDEVIQVREGNENSIEKRKKAGKTEALEAAIKILSGRRRMPFQSSSAAQKSAISIDLCPEGMIVSEQQVTSHRTRSHKNEEDEWVKVELSSPESKHKEASDFDIKGPQLRFEAQDQKNERLSPNDLHIEVNGQVCLTYFGQWSEVQLDCSTTAMENLYCAPEIGGATEVTEACDWWSLGAVLYELLTGMSLKQCHPSGILPHTQLCLPDYLSTSAASLLTELLQFDSRHRLGSGGGGVCDIKCHPFFSTVAWHSLSS
ncbi:ribosomal protein S6 kinase delta-1 isoform X3 [Erpetoichthys calabaricus]|uniref:ribosomal protein S6 kinase delta-1 isoform X3 n=1 Tax=Erpetoichthys calabaricus TaxID=27687 RepID=UPI0022342EA9|nr:ribosomal protein S6 kinase delta-1 isoform X3 [Erpetoichthys calabaricus]